MVNSHRNKYNISLVKESAATSTRRLFFGRISRLIRSRLSRPGWIGTAFGGSTLLDRLDVGRWRFQGLRRARADQEITGAVGRRWAGFDFGNRPQTRRQTIARRQGQRQGG